MEQRRAHRPLCPSPLAHCSFNAQQTSSPPSASSSSPSLGWSSTASMAFASSSPTRSVFKASYNDDYEPLYESSLTPSPWRDDPSTSHSTASARSLHYKSTTSARRDWQAPLSASGSSSSQSSSGHRWHNRLTQQCYQRAKHDRNKAINDRRNGLAGDYVALDRESREELAILRKMAAADLHRTSQGIESDFTKQQLDRLWYLQAAEQGSVNSAQPEIGGDGDCKRSEVDFDHLSDAAQQQ